MSRSQNQTLAIAFTQDFKLGHYMKIPPLVMFWAQIASTLIAGSVQLGVQMWCVDHRVYG